MELIERAKPLRLPHRRLVVPGKNTLDKHAVSAR
jgi:hypothetical protein